MAISLDRHSWQWFALPVATLGYAILLTSQPHPFRGLYTLSVVIYLIGLAEYAVILSVVIYELVKFRPSVTKLLLDPHRVIHRAAIWIATSSLIGGAHQLAQPTSGSALSTCLFALFWIYFVGAIIDVCTGLMIIFESRHHLEAVEMTPGWLLPLLPALLCGTLASILSGSLDTGHRIPVLVTGLVGMGMGFFLSLCIFAVFLNRLYLVGLPPATSRLEMFIAVSPPAFTAANLVAMSKNLPLGSGYFTNVANAVDILQVMALALAIFCWGLAIIFFLLALLSIARAVGNIKFGFTWYTIVFPIVGLILATIQIGDGLGSEAFAWASNVLTILLGMFLLMVYVYHLKKGISRAFKSR